MNRKIIENVLEDSINELKLRDIELLELDRKTQVCEISHDAEKLERKLHEVCINHRLAVYIEKYISKLSEEYYVDIEYNRYYRNHKYVSVDGINQNLRPDIIVHKRMKKSDDQHLLVVEAKKDSDDPRDDQKIRAFMNDVNYKYKFGARIIYKNLNPLTMYFYYFDNSEIKTVKKEYH